MSTLSRDRIIFIENSRMESLQVVVKYSQKREDRVRDADFELEEVHILWASQVVLVVRNQPVNVGDVRGVGLILGLGKSPEGGRGNPLQYSCLDNPMDRGTWWSTVHRVPKSRTRLKRLSTHTHIL